MRELPQAAIVTRPPAVRVLRAKIR